jgi:hypothetical protein
MSAIKQIEQVVKVSVVDESIVVKHIEETTNIKHYEVVQVFNADAPVVRYEQGFVNTSGFTVLATTHGIGEVRGVTLLDSQQIEMFADVTINQTTQDVSVSIGVSLTGTIIIY